MDAELDLLHALISNADGYQSQYLHQKLFYLFKINWHHFSVYLIVARQVLSFETVQESLSFLFYFLKNLLKINQRWSK